MTPVSGPVVIGIADPAQTEVEAFGRRLAGLLGTDAELVVEADAPARTLFERAEATRAAAIVIGATRRAVEGGIAVGSVGEQLLAGAPCALVVVPAGHADRGLERIAAAYVPGDQAAAALREAADLAGRCGAALELLAVADPHVVERDRWAGRADAGELAAAHEEVVRRHAEEAAAAAGATARVLTGDPSEQLRAESGAYDLLVCGSRDYGPVSGVYIGGVSKSLMHGAACPVMVVPRD